MGAATDGVSALPGAGQVAGVANAGRRFGKVGKFFKSLFKRGDSAPDVPSAGPTVGGGGTLDKLSPTEQVRIQNAANRSGQDIGVVGSRVNPDKTLRSDSDYDFVIDANNSTRSSLSRSLPGAKDVQEGLPSNNDVFKGQVDPELPHVIFHPEK